MTSEIYAFMLSYLNSRYERFLLTEYFHFRFPYIKLNVDKLTKGYCTINYITLTESDKCQ